MTNHLPFVFEGILSVGILTGCIASYMLLVISKGNILLNRLLVSLIAIICLLYILLLNSQESPMIDLTFLVRTFFPLHYVLSPLFYLYFRTFIQDDERLSRQDWVHFLPLGLHFLYISPLLGEILVGEVTWAHILSSVDVTDKQLAYGLIPNKVHTLLRMTVSMVYFGLMWKKFMSPVFSDFIVRNRDVYPFAIRWIRYYFWVSILLGIFSLLLKIQFLIPGMAPANDHRSVMTWMVVISFVGLFIYLIFNPVILFGLPHFLPPDTGTRDAKKDATLPSAPKHTETRPENAPSLVTEIGQAVSPYTGYLQMHIPPAYLEGHFPAGSEHHKILLLIDRIDRNVQDRQPYTQPSWNMDMLSKELGVPKHHLLYIFSHVLQCSFVDYRNELRVKHAQQALRNGISEYQTIESIGRDSGFPSRATFFSVFKKMTGMTPGQYLDSLI